MTEAELQRLAALLAEINPKIDGSPFNGWQIVAAFIAGVLVNTVTELIRSHLTRRVVLKASRAELYRNLLEYRMILWGLYGETNGKWSDLDLDNEENRKLLDHLHSARLKLRADLVSVDDRRYTRLILNALHGNPKAGFNQRMRALDKVLDRLEREALPLFEREEQRRRHML
jgi:hypothetical protein